MVKVTWSKIHHLIFYLPLFLFAVSSACAQDTTLYSLSQGSFTVKYIKNAGYREKNSNEILETIAEDAIKPPSKTKITLGYTLQIKALEKTPGVQTLFFVIRKPVLNGDLSYRKFRIHDILMPDRIDLAVKAWKKSDSASVMESKVSSILWNGDERPVFICDLHGFGNSWDSLEVINLFFYHDEEILKTFRERINLINDYYASSFVADSLILMADGMDLRNTGHYPVTFIRLMETGKIAEVWNRKDFTVKLNLDDHDPSGLIEKMNRLDKFLKSAEMTFRENLEKTDILTSGLSVDSMVSYFLSGIQRYIRWSLVMTSYNGGIYQEYLDGYFVKPAFGKGDQGLIREVLLKLFPGKDPDSLFRSLSLILKKAYENRAEWLIRHDQFMEALKILDNESRFCRVNPYLPGKFPDRQLEVKAIEGIYSSYLSVAEICCDNEKYDLARDYLVKARGYRHAEPDSNSSDTIFDKVFRKIFTSWIASCDSLAAHDEFELAVNCYHQTDARFDTSIHEAHTAILARISIVTNRLMNDPLGRTIYRNDLLDQLKTGESKIWTGQYEEARIFVDSVEKQFISNGFGDDIQVIKAIRSYRRKIQEQTCWDSKEAFEILIIRSQNEIRKNNYLKSEVLIDSALFIAGSAPLCRIDTINAYDTLKKYSVAVQYQKNIVDIRTNIRLRKYDAVLVTQTMNEGLYEKYDLSRFGLEPFPLYDVIEASHDPAFTGHALVFCSNSNSLSEAFRYLKLLRSQGYSKRNAKDMLEVLGKKMGAADSRKYPEKDPVVLLNHLTGDDGWFGRFNSSYLHQWGSKKAIR
jgi:hypothetical protein